MTKFVRLAGPLLTVTIGQGCSWEVTTNDEIGDEIGDATIKVSVMMLIMMIMMMMMMMVMLVMMLEMLVMAVVTVCYAFTHSLGHTVTQSHGHWVSLTRSLIHSFIHSFVHSLLNHTFPRSCIQRCRLPTINVKIVHWEWPISQRARRWHGRCPRCHQHGRRRLLSTPLPHLDVFDAESSACWLNGSEYIAACYQMTWSMSPMSSAWSTLSIVSAIVRLPHINVFDVVVVVVVVD
jgi:hypothetical protein